MRRLHLPVLASLPVLFVGFASLTAGERASAADEAGFKPIFDGKTLDGWDGDPKFWRVEDGAIVGQTTAENPAKGNTFLVWRRGEVDDFELRAQFRLHGGNSGIQVRSFENEKEWGKWVIGGYQADMDANNDFTGIVYGERYRGILAARGQKAAIAKGQQPRAVGSLGDSAEIASHIKKEEWNDYRIEARGNHLALSINGHPTSELTDDDDVARRSGLLALQLHAGPSMKVEFREIQLRRLPLGDKKKVVFIAGHPSHGPGDHEHNAGCLLLSKALGESGLPVLSAVYRNGWPKDSTALDNADAIVIYADGGDGHPAIPHLDEIDTVVKKGVGVACLHYAVEVPKGKVGDRFLDWIGGYFETNWSVNPTWKGDFSKLPDHPIARGVKPFQVMDEWYYHMRFPEDMKGVTPILEAVPPEETRNQPDGTHSGNAAVRARKGMSEVMAWAHERADGGRGFGFTGAHFHRNWGNEDFRKLVLNAIAWVAKVEVPANGVSSKPLSPEDLAANQDDKGKK